MMTCEIFRRWIHSIEEDAEGVEVFRPEGFAFPPSFGRDGFEMLKDGQFIQEDVGPADGIERTIGCWVAFGPQRVQVSFAPGAREGYTFEIVDVDASALRIRREAQQQRAADTADAQARLQSFQTLPDATSFRLLDFDRATIITLRSYPPQFILRVTGIRPYANMEVALVPVTYIQQPEYWRIEVVGSLPGIGLPAEAPYAVSLPLTGFMGTRGIEVAGATRTQQFDLATAGAEAVAVPA